MSLSTITSNAQIAFEQYISFSHQQRAAFLEAIATNIESLGDELIETASQETNLLAARLQGERGRTCYQLRMYAAMLLKGDYVDATIETAVPTKTPPKPDIRSMFQPMGPVVVFGASNFHVVDNSGGLEDPSRAENFNNVYKIVRALEGIKVAENNDLDAVLIAIRIATYGEEMEITTKVPGIGEERSFNIDKTITKHEKKFLYDELVVGNLRFVISVAKMFQNQGMDIMDIISEGNIGLMKAAERFDPTSGLKFISYAVWWVRQSIMASLNENARTIRLPSNLVQESQKSKKEELSQEDNFFINNSEEPVSSGLPYCVGLYKEINEDGDQLIDIIPNREVESPDAILNSPEEIKKKVAAMLSVLDDREKIIIERYYGLTGIESNLEDLGEEFGCTKERIRQLRDKAIKKLRNESFGLLNYL